MVNFISILQGIPLSLDKRQAAAYTTTFSSTILTDNATPIPTVITEVIIPSALSTNWAQATPTTLYTLQTSIVAPSVPLTTTFTPSPSCLSNWHANEWDLSEANQAVPTFYLPNEDRPECYPDDYFIVSSYSPGICPSGWELGYQAPSESASSTAGLCCPT
jgi:hypothetical protein